MPIDPGLQTPENYMTPAQLQAQRDYAKHLLQNQQQDIRSPWQGVGNVVQALIGGGLQHSANTGEMRARQQAAQLLGEKFNANDLGGVIGMGGNPYTNPDAMKLAAGILTPQSVDTGLGTVRTDRFGRPIEGSYIPKIVQGKVEAGGASAPAFYQGSPSGGVNEVQPGQGPTLAPPAGIRGGVPSSSRIWGEDEGRKAGLYEDPVNQGGPSALDRIAQKGIAIGAAKKRSDTIAEEGAKATMAAPMEAAKEVKTAPQMLNSLNIIEDTAKSYGDKITTGPFAEQVLKLKQAVNGVVGSNVLGDTAPAEIIKKMNAHLASAAIPAFTARGTQFDLKTFMDNSPGLNNLIKGTLFLTDIMKQVTRQNLELGKLASNPANYEKWSDVQQKYYESHPLVNPMTGTPLGVTKDTPQQTATTDRSGVTIINGRSYARNPKKPDEWLDVTGH